MAQRHKHVTAASTSNAAHAASFKLEIEFVHIAPTPGLTGFGGSDDGMFDVKKVLPCVFVL